MCGKLLGSLDRNCGVFLLFFISTEMEALHISPRVPVYIQVKWAGEGLLLWVINLEFLQPSKWEKGVNLSTARANS